MPYKPRRDRVAKRNTVAVTAGVAVQPGSNGGTLLVGNPGNKGGPGRPKDEIRERLRGIMSEKGVQFIEELFDGRIQVNLVGKCPNCDYEANEDELKSILDRITATVDHRLRAFEQTARYGLGPATDESLTIEVRRRLESTLTYLWAQLGIDHAISREVARIWRD